MGILSEIKLVIVILIFCAFGYVYARMEHEKSMREKAEQKLNLIDNNYGQGKDLLKSELKDPRVDSLLNANKIKLKNVQAITNIEYHYHNTFKSDSLVKFKDTSICVDYNYKGWSLKGCNGSYEDDRTFKATGILHRKPTKHFLFVKYAKKPVLQSWTEYGDTLNIKLVEK